MKKIFIYRVEDINGIGPYNERDENGRSTDRSIKLGKQHTKNPNTPGWGEDLIFLNHSSRDVDSIRDYISGFSSLKQLNCWFAGHLTRLLANGYQIKSYIVNKDNVIYGKSNSQVAFLK